MTKQELIEAVRLFIGDGKTDEAITLLQAHCPALVPTLVTDITLLEARFQNVKSDFLVKGILERADYDRELARINYAILDLLDSLSKTEAIVKNAQKSSGKLLHNIPSIMPLAREARCIVRIAYDEITVRRDIATDAEVTVQSVRIAEVMGVELLDFNEQPSFSIRTVNDAEQYMVEDDFTQWLFMVKPLREGKFPLTLKVSIIEEIDGKERNREIVLEKEVFIVAQSATPAPSMPSTTSAAPTTATAFVDTAIRFNYVKKTENSDAAGAVISGAVMPEAEEESDNDKGGGVIDAEPQTAIETAARGAEASSRRRAPFAAFAGIAAAVLVAFVGFWTYSSIGNAEKKSKQGDIAEHKDTPKNDTSHYDTMPIDTAFQNKQIMAEQSQGKPQNDIVKTSDKKNTVKNGKNTKKPKRSTPPQYPNDIVRVEPNRSHDPATTTGGDEPEDPNKAKNNGSGTVEEEKPQTHRVDLDMPKSMRDAEILVDGKPVKVKRNVFGNPQYIEFQSTKKSHIVTFVKDKVKCSVVGFVPQKGVALKPCSL